MVMVCIIAFYMNIFVGFLWGFFHCVMGSIFCCSYFAIYEQFGFGKFHCKHTNYLNPACTVNSWHSIFNRSFHWTLYSINSLRKYLIEDFFCFVYNMSLSLNIHAVMTVQFHSTLYFHTFPSSEVNNSIFNNVCE